MAHGAGVGVAVGSAWKGGGVLIGRHVLLSGSYTVDGVEEFEECSVHSGTGSHWSVASL